MYFVKVRRQHISWSGCQRWWICFTSASQMMIIFIYSLAMNSILSLLIASLFRLHLPNSSDTVLVMCHRNGRWRPHWPPRPGYSDPPVGFALWDDLGSLSFPTGGRSSRSLVWADERLVHISSLLFQWIAWGQTLRIVQYSWLVLVLQYSVLVLLALL